MPDLENRNQPGHSREADEIFGKLPSWIIRWGITVITAILLAVIIACCLIRYPQALKSRIVLTSDNPPSDLVARFSGILDSVYVRDGTMVSEGDLIALIATPAVYVDVRSAEAAAQRTEESLTVQDVRRIIRQQGLRLGDLQSDWIALQRSCADYLNWADLNQAGRKIAMLESQEAESKEYLSLLENQRGNVSENVGYMLKSFRRDSSLYAEKLISQAEYEQSIMDLHAKQNELTSLDATLSSARMSQLELRRQILELRLQESTEQMTYVLDIRRCSRELLSGIASWKETYAFLAPFAGKVSLQNVWSRGQHISVGDLVASIVRDEGNTITGRLKVSS
ncbi:MAG: biotin/lipoyl-binding protein, partial [Bacteroidales bacterium]|nr:biotin/lipoyl-binding protein [Bacteroidales bacterium]